MNRTTSAIDEIGAAPAAGPDAYGTLRDAFAVALMLSSAPCLALIFTATGPVLPLIAAHFAKPNGSVFSAGGIAIDGPFFAQLVATMPSFGLIVGGGPTGWLIDRLGVRRVLVGALLFFALFGSAGLYIDNPAVLLLSRLGLGFAAVALGAATVWLLGARFDGAGRARALSWRNILGGIAGVGSIWVVGDLAEAFGFHAVFSLFLIPLLLVPVALFAVPRAVAGSRAAKADGQRISLGFLWPIYALAVVLAIVMMINATQLSFLLADIGIHSPRAISHVAVMGSLASMAGSVLYAYAGPRLGIRGNYTVGAVLLGGGVAVVGLSYSALLASIGAGITGLGAGWVAPHLSRLVLDRAPEAARGRAVGLNFSAIYFGDFINPYVVRPLTLALGIHKAFILIGATVALTGLQIFVRRRPAAPHG
jgi:MFS family permease